MTEVFDRSAPVINRRSRDHHCFGCGMLNEVGLQLAFRALDAGVWAELCPDRRYEGFTGMVHGGILTAMLDEAMSWAIMARGEFAVTARLNTAFRNPAPVGSLLRVEGRIVEDRRRIIDTTAVVTDVASGAVVAEGDGRFMRVESGQAEAWRAAYGEVDSG